MNKLRISCLIFTWMFALGFVLMPVQPCPSHAAQSKITRAKKYVSDSAITTTLKAKFLAEKSLDSFDIKVKTTHGTVTLRGQVAKAHQYDLAEKIARETDGVQQVVNKISIVP